MAGMRDILIHDYIDVDLDIVWKTASESIVNLKNLLQNLTLKGWNLISTIPVTEDSVYHLLC